MIVSGLALMAVSLVVLFMWLIRPWNPRAYTAVCAAMFAAIVFSGCNVTIPEIKPPVIPPVIVTPTTTTTTTTTTQPPAVTPVCNCPSGKGSYVRLKADGTIRREVIEEGWLPMQVRCLLNDGQKDKECGIADFVRKANAIKIIDGKIYASCVQMPDGSWAHYVGEKHPSASSPMVKGQGVPVSGDILRTFYEGRQ